jgi:uncharacterized protein (TIGR02145 family)
MKIVEIMKGIEIMKAMQKIHILQGKVTLQEIIKIITATCAVVSATLVTSVASIALIALPILTSCEKGEKPTNGVEGNIITLSATSELPDTKTSLGNSNVVNWTTGDKITTFWGNITTAAEFTLSTGDGTTSATFTGTPTQTTDECYAIYPHNAATTIDAAKTISFTLPASQTYQEGGFANGANPMVAYKTATGALQFKNLCAVLKLQLKVASGTKSIKKITITSSTKKLSGAATVAMTYGEGVPAISMASDATANNYVELTLGDGVQLNTTAKAFYIVVPPVAAGEYSVTIETATEGMIKTPPSSTSTNALVRAKITTMPSLNFVGTPLYIENEVSYGPGIIIGSTTWAPVNCGYKPANGSYKGYTYGKLYQWGRKYGQGYKDVTYEDATYPSGDNLVTGQAELAVGQDAANAAKFYIGSSDYNEWLKTRKDDLWNSNSESSPAKTEYDPCPIGWRVPTKTELEALVGGNTPPDQLVEHNSQKGAWFNGTKNPGTSGVFLPAAGHIYYDGKAEYRNDSGLYYSSMNSGDHAYILNFRSAYLLVYSNPRAHGQSVRCVKD